MLGGALSNQQNLKNESEPADQPGARHEEPEPAAIPHEELMEDSDFYLQYHEKLEMDQEFLAYAFMDEYKKVKKSLQLPPITKRYLETHIVIFFSSHPADKMLSYLAEYQIVLDLSAMTPSERLLPFNSTPSFTAYQSNFMAQVKWPPSLQEFANIKSPIKEFPALNVFLNYLMIKLVAKMPFREAMTLLSENGFTSEVREQKKQEAKKQEPPAEGFSQPSIQPLTSHLFPWLRFKEKVSILKSRNGKIEYCRYSSRSG